MVVAGGVGLGTAFAVTALGFRQYRQLLEKRRYVLLVPSHGFDPDMKEVAAFAGVLAATRRRRWPLAHRADAIRMLISHEKENLQIAIGAQPEALKEIQVKYPEGCQVIPPPLSWYQRAEGKNIRRAELVLQRGSSLPLNDIGLDPDPLTAFARDVEGITTEGTRLEVCVDLMPARKKERRHLFQEESGEDGRLDKCLNTILGGLDSVVNELTGGSQQQSKPSKTERSNTEKAHRSIEYSDLRSKLGSKDQLFSTQVLIRASTTGSEKHAEKLVKRGISSFSQFSGANAWKVHGIGFGPFFIGSDNPISKRVFDRRWHHGRFAPAKPALLTTSEISGFLKAPTLRLPALNVKRCAYAPPPLNLPSLSFTGQKNMLPLGEVQLRNGKRQLIGMPLSDLYFCYTPGSAGFGKTENLLCQAGHLGNSGHGILVLDPHRDAIERLLPLLTEERTADRVILVDLSVNEASHRHESWNPISMEGRGTQEIGDRAQSLVSGLLAAAGWGDRATRAAAILTKTIEALMHLSKTLPKELSPTIYQVRTFLTDEHWRETVKTHLPREHQNYIDKTFGSYGAGDVLPITQLIDRLSKDQIKAYLGRPESTYDMRRAMDDQQIVLIATGGTDQAHRLVAGLIVPDTFYSAQSRMDQNPEDRKEFFAFIDEIQAIAGTTGKTLGDAIRELRKYKFRLFAANQDPEDLPEGLLRPLLNNRSLLITANLASDGAKTVANAFGGNIPLKDIQFLPPYTYLAQIGRSDPPFLLHGVAVDELFRDNYHPEKVAALKKKLREDRSERDKKTRNGEPKLLPTIAETVRKLETLDDEILIALGGTPAQPSTSPVSEFAHSSRPDAFTSAPKIAQLPDRSPDAD